MRRPAALLLLVLLLSACGSSPKTHFHTLISVPPAQTIRTTAHEAAGRPIEVGHVGLPGSLDRLWLVTRGRGTDIEVSDQDRWAAPLDELMQRALTADLRDRLGVQSVLAPGDPAPPGGVRVLAVNVERFSGDATGEVELEADYAISNSRPGSRSHHFMVRVNAGSARPDAITAAMSQAVGRLADDIASRYGVAG